ncbi:MAG TPA: GMC family oxidoreductase [Pseudolabrys sp.]|uniref:GMC family oxidoreductase n=1 Tax=Pseudolabrys sp. TaxID=1960880 RepID=UPI002DDD8B40|nr:GMC family oxidoreductase [Pseudolabrys sp.]HEV2630193.1 GMC family oxidoreductase [Pseudolabrys sp.]
MLLDLNITEAGKQTVSADVAVIGAGLAGLLLATQLAQTGLRVVVLESGARTQEEDRHALNEVVQAAQIYGGAEDGRFRCLGGTSTRWGGAMLPFESADLTAHPPGWDVDWPLQLQELSAYFDRVERLFALPEGSYRSECNPDLAEARPGFQIRSAKWPAFRMRNVTHVLRDLLAGDAGPEIWLNATATEFELDGAGTVQSVSAVSPGGRKLTVSTRCVAITAGAIESTRLLLLLDRRQAGRVFGESGPLGRYFNDHLSAECCRLQPHDRNAFIAMFGLRFVSGGMRDSRIEPTEALRRRLGIPGGFAHVTVESIGADGFTALREIYRAAQRKSMPRLSSLGSLIANGDWLAQAAYWRFAKGRLLPPRDAVPRLMLVIEQMPHADNRITLSPERRDLLGLPMATIDWRIRPSDVEGFRTLQDALVEFWSSAGFDSLASASPSPFEVWRAQMEEGGVVYHPAGSTRMGRSPANAVLDKDLRTFAISNLYVVSTSAFPSGGSANPSFMLLAFALRAADRIAQQLRK